MNLIINGKEEVIEKDGVSLAELLKLQNVEMPETVTVQLNDEFVRKEDFESTIIKDGDSIEFLYYMGGGK